MCFKSPLAAAALLNLTSAPPPCNGARSSHAEGRRGPYLLSWIVCSLLRLRRSRRSHVGAVGVLQLGYNFRCGTPCALFQRFSTNSLQCTRALSGLAALESDPYLQGHHVYEAGSSAALEEVGSLESSITDHRTDSVARGLRLLVSCL